MKKNIPVATVSWKYQLLILGDIKFRKKWKERNGKAFGFSMFDKISGWEQLPLTLRKLCFHFLSNRMGYDRGGNLPFDYEPYGILFDSEN